MNFIKELHVFWGVPVRKKHKFPAQGRDSFFSIEDISGAISF